MGFLTMECPLCEQPMDHESFHDEVWGSPRLVEEWHRCHFCSFQTGYSYGTAETLLDGTPIEIDSDDHWDKVLIDVLYESRTGTARVASL